MNRRSLALGAAITLAAAPAAQATSIPLLDLPPGTKALCLGVTDQTGGVAFDWALWGPWGEGWTVGVVGGVDYADPYRRDSHTMAALRVGRRLWGEWPVTVGALLSAGGNVVDPNVPPPNANAQRFSGDVLYWCQPALSFATRLDDQKTWVRGTVGPVIGRWSEGAFLIPWIVPNVEVGYRVDPSNEVVLGGGYASPYSLGWRTAF